MAVHMAAQERLFKSGGMQQKPKQDWNSMHQSFVRVVATGDIWTADKLHAARFSMSSLRPAGLSAPQVLVLLGQILVYTTIWV